MLQPAIYIMGDKITKDDVIIQRDVIYIIVQSQEDQKKRRWEAHKFVISTVKSI